MDISPIEYYISNQKSYRQSTIDNRYIILHPPAGAEFDLLFISLLAQRNEPKKEHPGQGLRLRHGVSKGPYHSDCARGRKCYAFIWCLTPQALSPKPKILCQY